MGGGGCHRGEDVDLVFVVLNWGAVDKNYQGLRMVSEKSPQWPELSSNKMCSSVYGVGEGFELIRAGQVQV